MTHDEMVLLWKEYKWLSLSSEPENKRLRCKLRDQLAEELNGDALFLTDGLIVMEHDGSLFEVNVR